MDHQSELEKSRYRNWVRGGLAYKYLKDGIEGFADEIVQQEHTRILHAINYSGGACNDCVLRSLRPIHKNVQDPYTGKSKCPWSQTNCNCVFHKKHRKCPVKVCDHILEEILKIHGSQPPTPNWRNTDVQKWCSVPWEIAKCFINSPGYSDKVSASDTDASGLLHIFINNISMHGHISTKITGTDIFSKTLARRNTIFHSPKLELEENELNDCIDDIIAILEDEHELKGRHQAQQAVTKLKELKQESFIITTHNEVEVCRDAMTSIVARSQELKEFIQDAKDDIDNKHMDVSAGINDQTKKALDDALKTLTNDNEGRLQIIKQTIELLNERVRQVEIHNVEMKQDIAVIKQRLTEIESNVERLDEARSIYQTQLEYAKQKQGFQRKLVDLYQRDYVKTWISPLKIQDNDKNINEVYITPSLIVDRKTDFKTTKNAGRNMCTVPITDEKPTFIRGYRDIFQTNCLKNKRIFIVGDVGSGKSSLGKMMIYDWCQAVTENEMELEETEKVEEMKKFEFLFFVPLQRMTRFSYQITDMIEAIYKDFVPDTVLHKIFEEEGDRCLIIADGLDEWIPPKPIALPLHLSYGLPVSTGIKHATILTLSRPSAKGILNMNSTEHDQKIKLQGIYEQSIRDFARKYMAEVNQDKLSLYGFMEKIRQSNLQHLEKTPLLLQQLIWIYCKEGDIGKSVVDVYGNILNIMFCWSECKDEEEDKLPADSSMSKDFDQMQLPDIIGRFPRCYRNQRLIFLLGKMSFASLSKETMASTFSRLELEHFGFTRSDIASLIKLGIMVENNCYDPKYEKTYLSLIHISFLEFFAAVYISSHYSTDQVPATSKENKNESNTVLMELFTHLKSGDDVLQLSNVLKMVCGLCPVLIREISRLISNIVASDDGLITYRNNLRKYKEGYPFNTAAEQIQRLIHHCLLEGGMDHQFDISLCDVVICLQRNMSLVRKLNPTDVLSLHINTRCINLDTDFVRRVEQFRQLQFTSIYIEVKSTSREVYTQLYSALRNLLSLKHLTLMYGDIINNIPLFIDLSGLRQLQSIHLENAYCILDCGVKQLENVYIKGYISSVKHDKFKQCMSSLAKSVSLKHLQILLWSTRVNANTVSPTIDLSDLKELVDVHLKNLYFKLDRKIKQLRNVFVTMEPPGNDRHEEIMQLALSLEQAVSLRELKLKGMVCSDAECQGHIIDLSGSNLLHRIHLENICCKFGVGTTDVNISNGQFPVSHDIYEQTTSSLTAAVSLKELKLVGLRCNLSLCQGHTIDLSEQDQLQSIHLEKCSHIKGTAVNAKHLHNVYYERLVNVSHQKCERLLLELETADALKQLTLKDVTCDHRYKDHAVNLTKHENLESVKISGLFHVSGLNVDNHKIKKLKISVPSAGESFFHLCDYNKLKHLEISKDQISIDGVCLQNVKRSLPMLYTARMNSFIQAANQLEELTLGSIDIDRNALVAAPEMQTLGQIKFRCVIMSFQTWCTFIDSLLTLNKSVQVQALYCYITVTEGERYDPCHGINIDMDMENKAAREYVKQKEAMFKVIEDSVSRNRFVFKLEK